jgi:hypothetical protein
LFNRVFTRLIRLRCGSNVYDGPETIPAQCTSNSRVAPAVVWSCSGGGLAVHPAVSAAHFVRRSAHHAHCRGHYRASFRR